MINNTVNGAEEQARRLALKNQDQRLMTLAVQGTGISAWEAEVLKDVVQEVYFTEPQDRPLKSGEIYYECVAATEGAGKPMAECLMVRVVLRLFERDDVTVNAQEGASALRRQRISRLSEQAREQGGLLSQEDLGFLLMSDVRTIRRDIRKLRADGIVIGTRGQQNDIGPGVTHKGQALKHWLEGQEPVEVARAIKHSLTAVERYLQHFSRVVFLKQKEFHPLQIAMTVGISTAQTNTYLELYEAYRQKPEYGRRWEEIKLIGASHYEAQDEKKRGSRSKPVRKEWRKP